MPSSPAVGSPRLARVGRWSGGIGLGCFALITLSFPAATRMWAWPWELALWITLGMPPLWLALRSWDSSVPLALPRRRWLFVLSATAVTILLSAALSPHRAQSLLWSASWLAPLAGFLIAHDWLQGRSENDTIRARVLLERALLVAFAMVGIWSVGNWLQDLLTTSFANVVEARNPYPLGHSNYTAGMALLMLPLGAAGTLRERGSWRALGASVVILAGTMLFSSGSRGGMLGLAAIAVLGVWLAPIPWRLKLFTALAAMAVGALFIAAHPRTRTLFGIGGEISLARSDDQRSAMFTAGWLMGNERPLLGWGPGTTPLVYPRFRGQLDGGAENVLQLHSAPVQIWAELGVLGLIVAAAALGLVLTRVRADAIAATSLLGYATFALTDWQLDVPFFGFSVALFAAMLAPPGGTAKPKSRRVMAAATLAIAILTAGLGRPDPTPEMNVEALALARDPQKADAAIALLRQSLAVNPAQEIAHFNLGWLQLVSDPPAAERHFLAAARLVPDKGGVYFGLGLARLNRGDAPGAARAFALECLNDPGFVRSGWWREPAIAAAREPAAKALEHLLQRAAVLAAARTRLQPTIAALQAALVPLPPVPAGPERSYRRERTGYPVLMRDLDLPPPTDLFDVRDVPGEPAALPAKGWLPSPILLTLLDETRAQFR